MTIGIGSTTVGGDEEVDEVTVSHETVAGKGRLLMVGLAFNNSEDEVATGVTYDGVAMDFVIAEMRDNDSRAEQWMMYDPPVGTFDVVATLDAVLEANNGFVVAAINFTEVNSADPLGASAGAEAESDFAEVTVASAVGDVVLDTYAAEDEGIPGPPGAGQTEQWNTAAGTGTREEHAAGSTKAGASPNVTMEWDIADPDKWALLATSIQDAEAWTPAATWPKSGDVDVATPMDATAGAGTDVAPVYLWTIGGAPGGGSGIWTPSDAVLSPSFEPDTVGTYFLELKITTIDQPDQFTSGNFESESAFTAPIVDAGGPYNGDVDVATALNATVTPGSDPTPVLTWTIDSGPGGGVFLPSASVEDPTFTPDTVGSYVLKLEANPSDGPPVSDTANFESDAVPPIVDAGGPYNGDSGQATALNATVTPGSDPTPALLWTIDSGGAGTFLPSAIVEDPTFTPTFPTVGPYTLRLTVTPSDGPAVFDTAAFESDPVEPIVDAGGPYSGTVDTPIALDATVTPGTDPAPTLLWTIDSGPGTGDFLPSATVEDPTFTPDLTGTYTLRLTVTSSDTAPVFDTASLDSQGFVPVAAQTVVGIKTDNIGRPICAFLGIGDPLPAGAVYLAGDALAFDGTLLVAIDDGVAPRTVVNGLPHTHNGLRIIVEDPGDVNLNGWRLRSEPLAQCINDGAPPPTPFYNKGFAIDGTGLLFVVDGGPAPTPPPAEFFPPAFANLQLWFDVQTNDVTFGPLSTINGVISLDGQNVREMNSRGTGAVAMIQNGGSPPIMRDNGSGPNGTRFLEHIGRVPLISNPDPSYTGGLTGYAFYVVCRANTIPLSAVNRDAYKWVPTLFWGNNTGNAWQVGFGSTARVTLKSMVLNQWVYLYGTIDNATDNYVAKASGVAQISGNYNTYNNPFLNADVQLGESSIDVVEAASYDRELTLLELTALETYFNDKFGL